MAVADRKFCNEGKKPFVLLKWKVKAGSHLFLKTVVLTYRYEISADGTETDTEEHKLKSTVEGTVLRLLGREGDTVLPGAPLLELQSCTHEVIMKDLCAQCGIDLRQLDSNNFEEVFASRSFSMVHIVPELKVSKEQAEQLDQADEARLLKCKKLVLLVDLDQTLIHTTNEEVPANLIDVYHFQLYGVQSHWYHTRLRPGTRNFLENISKFYELHIFTFGARLYAHKIAEILDSDNKLFSHRILSRDECFDATSKTGNLRTMFPRGDGMVCIIDDREDVWNFAPNVVHVKPYTYFRNTGDINAPLRTNQQVEGHNNSSLIPDNKAPATSKDTNDVSEFDFDTSPEDTSDSMAVDDGCSDAQNKSEEENCNIQVIDNEFVYSENNDKISSVKVKETLKVNLEGQNLSSNNSNAVEKQPCKATTKEQNVCSVAPIDVIKKNNLSIVSKESSLELQSNDESSLKSKDTENLENSDCENSSLYVADNYVDDDDYLLYLEEILMTIHKAYYDIYDQMIGQKMTNIPDLKNVIPYVRMKVLKDVNVVFSGVIPTNMPAEKSRLWTLAKSLGANVSTDLVLHGKNSTTHVVAAKLGTAKLNKAKKSKSIHIVTPNWLVCCATRWERADERLFPLTKEVPVPQILRNSKSNFNSIKTESSLKAERSNTHQLSNEQIAVYDPTTGKRIRKSCLRYNQRMGRERNEKDVPHCEVDNLKLTPLSPFMLSSEDLADMDREVYEACTTEESDKDCCESDDGVLESNTCTRITKRKLSSHRKNESLISEHIAEGETPCSKRKLEKACESLETDSDHADIVESNPNGMQSDCGSPSSDSESSDSGSICSEDEKMAAAVERKLMNS